LPVVWVTNFRKNRPEAGHFGIVEIIRGVAKEEPIEPKSVEKYLVAKVIDHLGAVSTAMVELVDFKDPDELTAQAHSFCEQFRPTIPAGEEGWSAAGAPSLRKIREMRRQLE
jgi:hypothetical protein